MANISKVSSVAAASIKTIDGVSKASIGKFNNLSFASSTTAYVSGNLEFHINANDSNSYDGTTTWTDLSGTENCTLVNGPTKPSGEEYVGFDGNDDRGQVTWASSDYFFGSTSNRTLWNTMRMQVIVSFDEDGRTGFVRGDAMLGFGSRNQTGGTRGFRMFVGRRGLSVDLLFGTRMDCRWPNTSEFQYNSSRGYYEPKPGRVYSVALTMDRTTSTNGDGHFNGFLNGAQWTPQSMDGSATQLNSTSSWDSQYINNSSVRKGRDVWYLNHNQVSSGALASSSLQANVHEVILYTDVLTSSEINQNLSAYTDRYGALN